MKIAARFNNSFCRECKSAHIKAGDPIIWIKGEGARAVSCVEEAKAARERAKSFPISRGGDVSRAAFAKVQDHLNRCCGEATDGECVCGLIESFLDGEDYGSGFGRAYAKARDLVTRVLAIKAHRDRALEAQRSGNYFALRTAQCEHGLFCQHDDCWCNDGEFFAG
jgi:hypothetical protein